MRRSAGPLTALSTALALFAGIGCTRAGKAEAPPVRTPANAREAGEKGRQDMLVVRDQKSVEVEPGTVVDLVVTRPVAIPHERQFGWPGAPTIEGDAVRLLRARIESPPPDVDGGHTTHHYELEAVKAGRARVSLAPVSTNPETAPPAVRFEVTVRAGSPPVESTASALSETVRRLAEAVATSAASPLEIARGFGEVETDSAGAVYVKPSDPRLKRVIVVKRRETGGLNDVQLQLAVPGSVTRSELEALLGSPQQPPPLAIETRTLIFRPALPEGARFRPTVTLTLDGDETGPATWVSVIRDPL